MTYSKGGYEQRKLALKIHVTAFAQLEKRSMELSLIAEKTPQDCREPAGTGVDKGALRYGTLRGNRSGPGGLP
jgi:hypothetical protein